MNFSCSKYLRLKDGPNLFICTCMHVVQSTYTNWVMLVHLSFSVNNVVWWSGCLHSLQWWFPWRWEDCQLQWGNVAWGMLCVSSSLLTIHVRYFILLYFLYCIDISISVFQFFNISIFLKRNYKESTKSRPWDY